MSSLLQKTSPTLARYQRYLKSYHFIAKDDKLCIAPCHQLISLELVDKKERSSYKMLKMDDIVTPGSRLIILVEAPSGFGKSTLCWELCRRWDTLGSLMQHYQIVLQLKLREKRIQNASELNEIFFHRDKRLSQSVVDEVLESEGEGLLLILDGFDEMPKSLVEVKSSLIMELISGLCLPNAVRLVTSRPSVNEPQKIFPEDLNMWKSLVSPF